MFTAYDALLGVMESDGTGVRLIYPDYSVTGWYPAWSPEGDELAFAGHEGPEIFGKAPKSHVFIASAQGDTRPRRVSSGEWSAEPAWSPDGSALAWTMPGGVRVHTLPRGPDRVIRPHGGGGLSDPAWSPDGETLALRWTRDGSSRIVLVDLATGRQEVLGPRGRNTAFTRAGLPAWSPDGERIAFVRPPSGPYDPYGASDLYVARRDGTHVKRLTKNSVPAGGGS